ncbi:MAG: ABC transporter ATP-binding protein/permease [Symbiobacteriaceae bacterium]|nr:ABC transporter ATP-binding protein/permease [Symbiobacteriaceae bacterium]
MSETKERQMKKAEGHPEEGATVRRKTTSEEGGNNPQSFRAVGEQSVSEIGAERKIGPQGVGQMGGGGSGSVQIRVGPGISGGPTEKAKDFKNSWLRLLGYIRAFIPQFTFAVLATAVATGLQTMGPNLLKEITDNLAQGLASPVGVNLEAVSSLVRVLAIIYLTVFGLNYAKSFVMSGVTANVSLKLRQEITAKIDRLPLKFFDTVSYGDLLSRLTNDVNVINMTFSQGLANLINAAVLLAGTLVMMLFSNIPLTLIVLVASYLGMLGMQKIAAYSRQYFTAQQQGLGAINGHIEEVFSSLSVVKAYNGSQDARRRFQEVNEELYHSTWRSMVISGLMSPLASFTGSIGYIAVTIAAAIMALQGSISIGVIVAFMLYVRMFNQPLSQIASAAQSLQQAAAAAERIFALLDEDEIKADAPSAVLQEVKGDIEFKGVSFGYNPVKPVLKEFSVAVAVGQKVAIVGATGSGKTTLMSLLMRFYEIDSGEILLDGVSLEQLSRSWLHEQFAMVLQDTWIFEGTIAENIIYNTPQVSVEELQAVCRTVGLHHFVQALPQGYDTVLKENASLSAGQKQLIAIARAMLKKAPLLILDEATSAIDTRSETFIQAACDKLMEGSTSFVIAHRLSTIRNADLILVLQDGTIAEWGKHQELLQEGGIYAHLYYSQFAPAA